MQQRIAQGFALPHVALGALTGQPADAGDVTRPFRHADRAARIQKIEQVGRLDAVIIRRQRQAFREQALGLRLECLEGAGQQRHVRFLEIVLGKLNFRLSVDLSVRDGLGPGQIVHIVHLLEIHGDALRAVRDLDRDRMKLDSPDLLKIGKLRDLHPIQPHLPSQSPGSQGRRLPIILDEPDVVLSRVDAEMRQALQVERLNLVGRRFKDNLVLVVVLHPVRIVPVPAVSRAPAGLRIGRLPGLRTQRPQKRGRVEGSGSHFQIVGLMNDAALVSPIAVEGEDQLLEGHSSSLPSLPSSDRGQGLTIEEEAPGPEHRGSRVKLTRNRCAVKERSPPSSRGCCTHETKKHAPEPMWIL